MTAVPNRSPQSGASSAVRVVRAGRTSFLVREEPGEAPAGSTPVLLLHGERDALIGPHHSDSLKALAPAVTVVHIPDAAHNDLQDFEAYLNAFAKALAAL